MTTAYTSTDLAERGGLERIGDIAVWHLIGLLALFSTSVFNLVAWNADKVTAELDSQVIIKLLVIAIAGIYGSIGFVTDPRVREVAFSFPAFCLLGIISVYFLASLAGIDAKTSLVSSISILAVFLMTITAMIHLGRELTVEVLFWSAGTFVVLSWLVYLLVPSIGIMLEPISDGEFKERMSGLAHPNTLGQYSAICVCLGTVLYLTCEQKNKWVLFVTLLAAAALLNSLCRTAMVATVVALVVGYRHEIFSRRGTLLSLAGLFALGLVAVMYLSTQMSFESLFSDKIQLLTKSGDTDELFTATGRGEIWAETIRLIKQRPLLGYGPTSSKLLLGDYSLYTHNLILNVGLSAGVGALCLAVAMCFGRFCMLFKRRHPVADTLVVLVLTAGFFENVIFSNICGFPTICWIVGLVWFQAESAMSEEPNE